MDSGSSKRSDPLAALRFRWPWRPYQQRVLDAAEAHLADRRLHVVAAPGAGKTSLGLELVRRLARPALVLAPTRTIRDQWLERLRDFLPDGGTRPAWASADLEAPGVLTVATYQALHARKRREQAAGRGAEPSPEEGGEDEPAAERGGEGTGLPSASELRSLSAHLRHANVGTLVLDEAHHLQQAWWRVLARLVEGLDGVRVVSLTATPPYDVTGPQWARYEALCGPVDEEISVPELVRAGTLCPHQDLVWTVAPAADEAASLRAHDAAVERLGCDLLADGVLLRAVEAHPWVSASEPDAEQVLERPELAVALLALLRAARRRLPAGLLALLDGRPRDLPRLDRGWWQVLLEAYLDGRGWPRDEAIVVHRRELRARLRREGLLWRRELRLADSRPLATTLTLSRAKIDACRDVLRLEREARGERLRQVILTDYIEDADLARADGRLGAWPLLRALARPEDADAPRDLGLVTGRLAVVHAERAEALRDALPGGDALETQALEALPGYVRVRASGGGLVAAFTRLLAAGELRVLVGTRALLGEGWDAPCVNSLVMASHVGAFVTTNQMRGRAIRVDPDAPDKTASLWHLVAVDPGTASGTSDWRELERRFATFVGLSADGARIESGLERLELPAPARAEDLVAIGRLAAQRLRDLPGLRERWRAAVDGGVEGRVRPTLRTPPARGFRRFLLTRTLRFVLVQALCTWAWFSFQGLRQAHLAESWSGLLRVAAWAAAGGFLLALPGLVRAAVLLARHLPVDGSVRQIALALRDALCAAGLLETPRRRLAVGGRTRPDGAVELVLAGGTFHEQSLFVDALRELLAPVANPRYLITRQGRGLLRRRRDVHAVPAPLGARKELAGLLRDAWRKRLGPCELVYTRQGEGRRRLLEARVRSFSAGFASKVERVDRWH